MSANAKADFIISYDISDPKRLQKLARQLEKVAMRIQYSIFLLSDAMQTDLFSIVNTIEDIIDHDEDDVRIYRMIDPGIAIGQAVNLEDPYTFSA